jgi:hypothetical protein
MKKLYMLAMSWIAEKEAQGLSREEAHRQVGMIADYLDFVWKHRQGNGGKKIPAEGPSGAEADLQSPQ